MLTNTQGQLKISPRWPITSLLFMGRTTSKDGNDERQSDSKSVPYRSWKMTPKEGKIFLSRIILNLSRGGSSL